MTASEGNSGTGTPLIATTHSADASKQPLWYGLFLLVVGPAFLIGGARITPSGLTNERDIGPRVAPMAIGSLIMLGGVSLTGASLAQRRRLQQRASNAATPMRESGDPADAAELDTADAAELGPADAQGPAEREQVYRAWFVLGGLVACTALMPRWGFVAPAFVFTMGVLMLLRAKWWEALASAALILFVVHILFVRIFQVVLPSGPFGF